MHVTLFEDTLKNAKVGKRPKRGTKSSNYGVPFFAPFLEPRLPKKAIRSLLVLARTFCQPNSLSMNSILGSNFWPAQRPFD